MTALDQAVERMGIQSGLTSWRSAAAICGGCGAHSYEADHQPDEDDEEGQAELAEAIRNFPHGRGCLYLEAKKELAALRAK